MDVLAQAVVFGDPDAAFVRYARGRDTEEIVTAVLLWIDTISGVTPHKPIAADEDAFFGFDITDSNGEPVDVDDVEPELAWAARVVTARLNRDRDQFNAMFSTINNHIELLNRCAAVLELVAGAVKPAAVAHVRAHVRRNGRP